MSQVQSETGVRALLEQRQRFLAFLERRVGSPSDAEDILQRAFLKALEQDHTLRRETSAVAWFYRILRNAVIDHYRSQAAAGRMLERWAQEIAAHPAPDPELRASMCACILPLLQMLKPEYQRALQAIEVDEQSLRQFAADAGITPQNAAVRVHRARTALRKKVLACCGACATHGCTDCHCPPGRAA